MGIILVLAIIMILGLVSFLIYQHTKWASEGWLCCGITGMITAGLLLFICGIGCLVSNFNISIEKDYQDLIHTKEIIEYRLENIENEENVTVNGGVYNDVIEYNNKIRKYKMYTHNFWIGWFYADKPATLDYIELPKSVS